MNAGYQVVLKRYVDHHQRCDGAPLVPLGQLINEVSNYPDLRLASIVRGAQGIGRQIYTVIEISETAPGVSKIELWSKIRPDDWARHYKNVAEGSDSCGL